MLPSVERNRIWLVDPPGRGHSSAVDTDVHNPLRRSRLSVDSSETESPGRMTDGSSIRRGLAERGLPLPRASTPTRPQSRFRLLFVRHLWIISLRFCVSSKGSRPRTIREDDPSRGTELLQTLAPGHLSVFLSTFDLIALGRPPSFACFNSRFPFHALLCHRFRKSAENQRNIAQALYIPFSIFTSFLALSRSHRTRPARTASPSCLRLLQFSTHLLPVLHACRHHVDLSKVPNVTHMLAEILGDEQFSCVEFYTRFTDLAVTW